MRLFLNMADITIKFWGVRGSIPTPHLTGFGGNTSCVEVQAAGKRIILDAGTGLYQLSLAENIKDADILLSHTHIDHIIGFPFFKPLYNKDSTIRIWAGNLRPETRVEEALHSLMSPPLFPLSLKDLKAKIEFFDFTAGEEINPDHLKEAGVTVKTLPINHPDRATAYRIENNGKSVCYVTDIELGMDKQLDVKLGNFLKNADVVIVDSTYDDANIEKYKGWGHSSWQQAMELVKSAGAKKFVAFHHDPEADDTILENRDLELSQKFPGSFLARERTTIEI